MKGTRLDIANAEKAAAAAHADINVTIARLKVRLSPKVRARETWEDVRDKGELYADDALEFAYEKPSIVASAGGVIALLLLRRPIVGLFRRIFSRRPRWDKVGTGSNVAIKTLARPAAKLPANGGERR